MRPNQEKGSDMKLIVKKESAQELKTACLVAGVFEGQMKSDLFTAIDRASSGALSSAIRSKEFSADKGQMLLLHSGSKITTERFLLVGLGKRSDFSLTLLRQTCSDVAKYLGDRKITDFHVNLNHFMVKKATSEQQAQVATEGFLLADYRYDLYLPTERAEKNVRLKQVTLLVSKDGDLEQAKASASCAAATCAGVAFARDLVNAPGNLKSPEYLARQAQAMAEQVGIKASLLDQRQLEQQGFGAMLGVAQGSERSPFLIVLEYQGGQADEKPVALVGKGVVFDAGGISLKPAEKMDEMKMDMGGAAAVLGAMRAAAEMKLPLNLVALVPAVENMPSGSAFRPGDILTSLSGKTVEVLNTDAEGRLILADALTYVERFKPRVVIDLATLTGACIVALGDQAAAVLGNNDGLIRRLLKAGEDSGERLWQLPLWEGYSAQIKSDFADVKNSAGRTAGAITAAAFLQTFAEGYRWAHLDIAGMAWAGQAKAGQPKGGTGFGVRVLLQYLRNEIK